MKERNEASRERERHRKTDGFSSPTTTAKKKKKREGCLRSEKKDSVLTQGEKREETGTEQRADQVRATERKVS